MSFTSSWSSAGGASISTGGEGGDDDPLAALSRPELTDVEKGIAWFKIAFGVFYVVLGVGALGVLFYVRDVFEIRARSPYLVMLNGIMLLVLISIYSYTAEEAMYGKLPFNVEDTYIVSFFTVWALSGGFWTRVLRLGLSYSPRLRRRLPWLMSERLLVCCALLIGLAGTIQPVYRAHTNPGGQSSDLLFVQICDDDRETWTWVLLGVTLLMAPIVWRVDDIFTISREMLAFIVIQTFQTVGTRVTEDHASVETQYWINEENIPFIGTVTLFGLTVIDPLRRLFFNPLSNTYPAFARAHSSRREAALRALKNNFVSELTESHSHTEPGSSSSSELNAPRKRDWSYQKLASVPELAEAFRAFAFRALCQESVLFLEEVAKYQHGDFSMCRLDNQSQRSAFVCIVARFIADGSPDEVNISYTDKHKILELSRAEAEKFDMLETNEKRTVFGEAYVEIRYMLETNLLTRFTETQEFRERERRAPPAAPGRRHLRRNVKSITDGHLSLNLNGAGVDEEDPQTPQEGVFPTAAVLY